MMMLELLATKGRAWVAWSCKGGDEGWHWLSIS